MVEEINNILDGLQDSGLASSDLRQGEISANYEGQEWSAEVKLDDLDGEEYVQVSYNVESASAEDISRLAETIGSDKVEWGIDYSNLLEISEPKMLITRKESQGSLSAHPRGPSENEIESNETVAEQLGFENQTESWQTGESWQGGNYLQQYQCDVFSRDQPASHEELINTLVQQPESYFIETGSDIRDEAEMTDKGETVINETARLNARLGEENSATIDVYIPIEDGIEIDSYTDVGLSEEHISKMQEAAENIEVYGGKVYTTSESADNVTRMPSSETLTKLERQIGQRGQVRVQ